MLQTGGMTMLLVAGAAIFVLAGCQATTTARSNGYVPANCGMVGSSCSSGR